MESTDFPALALWMEGADADHPLYQHVISASFLGSLNEILESLELAQPLRINRKRQAFRKIKTFNTLLEQRAELLAASLLARASVNFEFAVDYPDLVLSGNSGGIEVGTR